jgi:hypothetical protein
MKINLLLVLIVTAKAMYAQYECNDSIYYDLKRVSIIGLNEEDKKYIKYYQEHCKKLDSISEFKKEYAKEIKIEKQKEINKDKNIISFTVLKNDNVFGITGSYSFFPNPDSCFLSIGKIFEMSFQQILKYNKSVFFGFGGAIGFLFNFNKVLSLLIDLRIPFGTITEESTPSLFIGIGSNQEMVFRIGRNNRLILGFGLSETGRTIDVNPFIFGYNFKIGFEIPDAF